MDDNEKYTLEITRKLDAFKTAKEWSDFITLLSSLDAVIKKFNKPFVPKKELLFKRLNQCLNPALPAGVHNKVLGTYDLIFEKISRKNLIKDFDSYTLGIFSFSVYSRILVTNEYLNLLEKHIVPLGHDIEHYSYNVLIGLLPSMESQSSEFYDRTYLILVEFLGLINPRVFFVSIWNCYFNDPQLRIPICNFFSRCYDLSLDIIADNKILVTKALCCGLSTPETLVVRGTLDMIIRLFPKEADVFSPEILVELCQSMITLFLKRDISLNKRIYSWLGITDSYGEKEISLIEHALRNILLKDTTHNIVVFFRILTTLSDKDRLSDRILESLLFLAIEKVKTLKNKESNVTGAIMCCNTQVNGDMIKYANIYLSTDLDILWKIFYIKLEKSIQEMRRRNEGSIMSNVESELRQEQNIEHINDNLENKNTGDLQSKHKGGQYDDGLTNTLLDHGNNLKPSPNKIVFMILFCLNNLSIVDQNVLSFHLPFLTYQILSNVSFFDDSCVYAFMQKSLNVFSPGIKVSSPKRLGTLIYEFYVKENTELLTELSSLIFSSIIAEIEKLFDSNIFLGNSVLDIFVRKYGAKCISNSFVKKYYETVVRSSLEIQEQAYSILLMMDVNELEHSIMFNELWRRFVFDQELKIEGAEKTDHRSGSDSKKAVEHDVCTMQGCALFDDRLLFALQSKKKISHLMFKYNRLFNNEFEKLLLLQIKSSNLEHMAEFAYYIIESENNNDYYFLEVFYILCNTLELKSKILAKLITSLTKFDILISYFCYVLHNSNIESENNAYLDVPNFSRVLGVLNCFKVLVKISEKFASYLIYNNSPRPGLSGVSDDVCSRVLILKILHYFIVTGFQVKVINKELGHEPMVQRPENLYRSGNAADNTLDTLQQVSDQAVYINQSISSAESLIDSLTNINSSSMINTDDSLRDILLLSLSVMRRLVQKKIINREDVKGVSISQYINTIKLYRYESAVTIPASYLMRLISDHTQLVEFYTLLDENCSFYYEFLFLVHNLPSVVQNKVVSQLFMNIKKGPYCTLVCYELVAYLFKKDAFYDWENIIGKSVRIVYEFCEDNSYLYSNVHRPICKKEVDLQSKCGFYGDALNKEDSVFAESFSEDVPVRKNGTIEDNDDTDHYLPPLVQLQADSVIKLSLLIFKKMPKIFVDLILNLPFNNNFINMFPLKLDLYTGILANSGENSHNSFRFLLTFNKMFTNDDLSTLFNKSIDVFSQMNFYRNRSDNSYLNYVLSTLYDIQPFSRHTNVISTILANSIFFLTKRLDALMRSPVSTTNPRDGLVISDKIIFSSIEDQCEDKPLYEVKDDKLYLVKRGTNPEHGITSVRSGPDGESLGYKNTGTGDVTDTERLSDDTVQHGEVFYTVQSDPRISLQLGVELNTPNTFGKYILLDDIINYEATVYHDEILALSKLVKISYTEQLRTVLYNLSSLLFLLINSKEVYSRILGIDLLYILSHDVSTVSIWKQSFLDCFHTIQFFSSSIYKRLYLIQLIVKDNPAIIAEFFLRLEGSFFVTQASDVNNKVLVLRRISFVIFSSPLDHFLGYVVKLIEIIATLIGHTSLRVKKEILFLCRIMLLKISHVKLINLYPILFADMMRLIDKGAENDVGLLVEALKVLDVMFLLNTPQVSELRFIFLDPKTLTFDPSDKFKKQEVKDCVKLDGPIASETTLRTHDDSCNTMRDTYQKAYTSEPSDAKTCLLQLDVSAEFEQTYATEHDSRLKSHHQCPLLTEVKMDITDSTEFSNQSKNQKHESLMGGGIIDSSDDESFTKVLNSDIELDKKEINEKDVRIHVNRETLSMEDTREVTDSTCVMKHASIEYSESEDRQDVNIASSTNYNLVQDSSDSKHTKVSDVSCEVLSQADQTNLCNSGIHGEDRCNDRVLLSCEDMKEKTGELNGKGRANYSEEVRDYSTLSPVEEADGTLSSSEKIDENRCSRKGTNGNNHEYLSKESKMDAGVENGEDNVSTMDRNGYLTDCKLLSGNESSENDELKKQVGEKLKSNEDLGTCWDRNIKQDDTIGLEGKDMLSIIADKNSECEDAIQIVVPKNNDDMDKTCTVTSNKESKLMESEENKADGLKAEDVDPNPGNAHKSAFSKIRDHVRRGIGKIKDHYSGLKSSFTKRKAMVECNKSMFKRLSNKLKEKYKIQSKKHLIIPRKKIPLFRHNSASVNEIIEYLDSASLYYNLLDLNCTEIDADYLVEYVLGEFKDGTGIHA